MNEDAIQKNTSVSPRGNALDAGLLVLRLGVGLSLCALFGLRKLEDGAAYLHSGHWQFVDFNRKIGLPVPVLVAYAQSFNESLGALLVACGFLSRYAATLLFLGFAVATYCSLRAREEAWLMAAYFALMFGTIALTGPGRFSVDSWVKSPGLARRTRQSS